MRMLNADTDADADGAMPLRVLMRGGCDVRTVDSAYSSRILYLHWRIQSVHFIVVSLPFAVIPTRPDPHQSKERIC
jgi:hypothetical protein